MNDVTIHLRPGHVQPVWMGHPWVYAQAIARIEGSPAAGDVVAVHDPRGNFLGKGYWSPASAIPVRILTRDPESIPEAPWLRERIGAAAEWRQSLLHLPSPETDGYRLINAEGDGLPGLIADVYAGTVSVQFLTAGMKRREGAVLDALMEVTGAHTAVEVASARHQKLEGFEAREGVVRGEPVTEFTFNERGIGFTVAAPGGTGGGQKTGFYFDQRENRAMVEALADGRRVLDVCSYVGGFALAALRGGAREASAVESSAPAIAMGERNAARAGVTERLHWHRGDARKVLAEMATAGERFDIVVLDPPKFAQHAREVADACAQYRRLNALGARVLAPGGLLVSCSCSGAVGTDDFLRALAGGARDVGRDARVLKVTGAAPDHPCPAAFPDGRYLQCVLARLV